MVSYRDPRDAHLRGSGRVTSSPGDIDCGSVCSDAFGRGTEVELFVKAETDSLFTGWGGDCAGSADEPGITVTMDADLSCTATFEIARQLEIVLEGTGTGTVTSPPLPGIDPGIDCPGDCSGAFAEGSDVTLAAADSLFTGWSGDCSGSADESVITVTMEADRSCTATFEIVIGEVGQETELTHVARKIDLQRTYDTPPVVIAGPPSRAGGDPRDPRWWG